MIKILTATQALPSIDEELTRIEGGIKRIGEGSSPRYRCVFKANRCAQVHCCAVS